MYFFRATSPLTISTICGCSSGSPPGIETIGTPHSSTAAKHSPGESCFFRIWGGYCTFPQPAQARLQRKSGSSISTSGYFFSPASFFLITYVATVHICEMGTPMVQTSCALELSRVLHSPLVGRKRQQREIIAVHVIREIEHAWKSSSCVKRLPGRAFAG